MGKGHGNDCKDTLSEGSLAAAKRENLCECGSSASVQRCFPRPVPGPVVTAPRARPPGTHRNGAHQA